MPLVLLEISDISNGLSGCRSVKLCLAPSCTRLDPRPNGMLQGLAQPACLQFGNCSSAIWSCVSTKIDAQYRLKSTSDDRAQHINTDAGSTPASGVGATVTITFDYVKLRDPVCLNNFGTCLTSVSGAPHNEAVGCAKQLSRSVLSESP